MNIDIIIKLEKIIVNQSYLLVLLTSLYYHEQLMFHLNLNLQSSS